MVRQAGWVLAVWVALLIAHWPLLSLPYFWDEAGFYVPAAHDLLQTGSVIPQTTLLTAHPPLAAIYLATAWRIFGEAPMVTRAAMLLVAAFGLVQLYGFLRAIAVRPVALAATALTAVYPVFFAQSSLAHSDLMAAALSWWGLKRYFGSPIDRRWSLAAFTLAALAKETAVLVPGGLFLFALAMALRGRRWPGRERWGLVIVPGMALAGWYGYHYAHTGHVFGDASFFRYNVAETLNPLRFLFALVQRVWQVCGHMNLWLLTAAALAAMLLPLGKADGKTRERIAIPTQACLATIVAVHLLFHSLIGGALLSRYLEVLFPLVIVVWVATLQRRVRYWAVLAAAIGGAFIIGWTVNPWYRFAPEDNLNYAEFLRLHQAAAITIEERFPRARILTAWPAADELTKPYLGFVREPHAVITIADFSLEQLRIAQANSEYAVAFAFSTKYEPARPRFEWRYWQEMSVRFFGYHRDLPPEAIAAMLGGRIVFLERAHGQWVAVIAFDRAQNASLLMPSSSLRR